MTALYEGNIMFNLVIPEDKMGHALLGGILAAVITAALFKITASEFSIFGGVGAALAAGILKEVYDSFHPDEHTVDILDVIATVLGGVIGATIILVAKIIIFGM